MRSGKIEIMSLDELFPRGDDVAELAAAERAFPRAKAGWPDPREDLSAKVKSRAARPVLE